ncbi:uncharacterized protein METZ01_LOCUS165459 [marine metagenome]|uniref:Uncharacterized protein n=1 Tax=marine metagenome TaxID=408172 RepID=A0A382BFM0_9ZZZZ
MIKRRRKSDQAIEFMIAVFAPTSNVKIEIELGWRG